MASFDFPFNIDNFFVGCNLFRDEFSKDETSNYSEIVNTDYELAQDCIIFKSIDAYREEYFICTKAEWNAEKKLFMEIGSKVEIVRNIPSGTECKIIEIHSSSHRSGHIWLTFYTILLKIEDYTVRECGSWDTRKFLYTSKKTKSQ